MTPSLIHSSTAPQLHSSGWIHGCSCHDALTDSQLHSSTAPGGSTAVHAMTPSLIYSSTAPGGSTAVHAMTPSLIHSSTAPQLHSSGWIHGCSCHDALTDSHIFVKREASLSTHTHTHTQRSRSNAVPCHMPREFVRAAGVFGHFPVAAFGSAGLNL
ncbi:hypothetical protein RRG08_003336 [Elysia crispata]|uniref:Uncharacterized protein n=1 Tax=Elysia crispata TaxID=231223 RepID=A0AAE1A8B9_9GAST|nr:hypothetical protein RRG08_003336 [Elysia crispata]